MSHSLSMFDTVVKHYVEDFCRDKPKYTEEQIDLLAGVIQRDILADALPQIEESIINSMKKRAEEEAKAHKRKLLQKVKVTLIVETIFLAFFVGIIVNQITNLIPASYCWGAIIISLLLCVLLVWLATAEPG